MIELSQLTKGYGPLTAVDGLTLRVEPGEVYAPLGPNGAGTTTALRCLATLLRPSAGSAAICGIDVVAYPLEMVELFSLGGFADRFCGRLSTGQRQRVALALVRAFPALVGGEAAGPRPQEGAREA